MDIWGYCEHCDRWFDCPMERAAEWTCPSCGIEPLRIENRAPRERRSDHLPTAHVMLERTRTAGTDT